MILKYLVVILSFYAFQLTSQCVVSGGGGNISAGTSQTYSLTNCDPCKNCNSPNYWYITIPAGGSVTINGTTYTGPSTESFNTNANLTVLYNNSGSYDVWWEWGSSTCSPSCPGGGISLGPTVNVTNCSTPNACWMPIAVCESNGIIDLSTLLCPTATSGGTWSGSAVSTHFFDPTGLNGQSVSITYSVGAVGCQANETHSIMVSGKPNVPSGNDTTLLKCNKTQCIDINLTRVCASGTLEWFYGNNPFSDPVVSNPSNFCDTFNTTVYGYCYDNTLPIGCVYSDSVATSIVITQPINPCWTAGSSLCENSATINLNNLLCPGATTGGYWTGLGVIGNQFSPSGLGGQNVTITYHAGTAPCDSSESHTFFIASTPTQPSGGDTTVDLCYGKCFNLNAARTCNNGTLRWYTIPNPTISTSSIVNPTSVCPTGNTIYYGFCVANLNPSACQIGPSISTTINIIPSFDPCWNSPSIVCNNEGKIYLNDWLCTSSTLGGSWSGQGVSGDSLDPSVFGGQTLNITYQGGINPCDSFLTQDVVIRQANPQFETFDFCFGEHNVVAILGDLGGSFSLTSGINAQINSSTGVLYGASMNEDYTIQYKVNTPCTDSSELTIRALDCDSTRSILFVPNTFSPNFDGKNDQFQILSLNIESYHLYIFNRWGQLIFESTDTEEYWDGTFKGSTSPTDTYVWRITYMEPNSVVNLSKHGHLNLIR